MRVDCNLSRDDDEREVRCNENVRVLAVACRWLREFLLTLGKVAVGRIKSRGDQPAGCLSGK